MTTTADTVLAAFAALPENQQQLVAEAVVLGPEEHDAAAWERTWLDEVRRRRASGLEEAVPFDAFVARVRSRWSAP
jgi:hypothetical protein